jgi:hypothetical protein
MNADCMLAQVFPVLVQFWIMLIRTFWQAQLTVPILGHRQFGHKLAAIFDVHQGKRQNKVSMGHVPNGIPLFRQKAMKEEMAGKGIELFGGQCQVVEGKGPIGKVEIGMDAIGLKICPNLRAML